MRTPWIVVALCAMVLLSAEAIAQQVQPEPRVRVAASAAFSNLYRIEDRSYGRTFNAGGGIGFRVTRRLWLDVEANRFFGLEADPAPCGLVDIACTGGGREGYNTATLASVALTYHFGLDDTPDAHVAVTGGLGYVRAGGFATTTFGITGQQIEMPVKHDGWGPKAGVSLRVPVRSRWGIEPAFRIYGADAPNLTVIRISVALTRDF